ncbi:MAG: DNA-3-methyladenine glycosylase [Gammaproteobacteria bacterium]
MEGGTALFGGDYAPRFDATEALAHLRLADPVLARHIDRVGPFRMKLQAAQSPFLALAEAIVYQQLSGKAAATIFARMQAALGGCVEPRTLLAATDDCLRGAGLSRPKLMALRDLAHHGDSGRIPDLRRLQSMDDEAIVECLTQVRGVGRWTVQMLLMFRLGRPDVLPADDYGIRKGFAVAFRRRELPDRATVERRGARWKPWRTVASWYLWRAVDPG